MAKPDQFLDKSDAELVALTLENKEYYLHLVKRYEKKLLRYISRLAGLSCEDAEDVLQEVFIKAYQNLNDFDRSLKFSSWIYRIAHNETVSFLRKRNARPKIAEFAGDFNIFDNIPAQMDIEAAIDRQILAGDIGRAMQTIDPRFREVLMLKYFEDKDYREISDILKKPMGTVATLMSRAKRKLEAELSGKKDFLARYGIFAAKNVLKQIKIGSQTQ